MGMCCSNASSLLGSRVKTATGTFNALINACGQGQRDGAASSTRALDSLCKQAQWAPAPALPGFYRGDRYTRCWGFVRVSGVWMVA
eukprot:1628366-Prorocentrum_lima.AAC.1